MSTNGKPMIAMQDAKHVKWRKYPSTQWYEMPYWPNTPLEGLVFVPRIMLGFLVGGFLLVVIWLIRVIGKR